MRTVSAPLRVGDFIGEITVGGSWNCIQLRLVTHCNGITPHVWATSPASGCTSTRSRRPRLLPALLPKADTCGEDSDLWPGPPIASSPHKPSKPRTNDGHGPRAGPRARTVLNDPAKPTCRYSEDSPPPYLTRRAAEWLLARGIQHLLLDVPSVDRIDEGGHLTPHRVLWACPAARCHRRGETADQRHRADVRRRQRPKRPLLDLQVAPFAADVAPSRPVLYRVIGE